MFASPAMAWPSCGMWSGVFMLSGRQNAQVVSEKAKITVLTPGFTAASMISRVGDVDHVGRHSSTSVLRCDKTGGLSTAKTRAEKGRRQAGARGDSVPGMGEIDPGPVRHRMGGIAVVVAAFIAENRC